MDRKAVETVRSLGMVTKEMELPDWPYDSLNVMLFAEAAAAFEELTLSGEDAQLKMQVADAWPNIFRQSRFLSAVDFVQADRNKLGDLRLDRTDVRCAAGGDVDDVGVGFDDGEVVDAAAHDGGSDAAEFEIFECRVVGGLAEEGGGGQRKYK